MKNTMMLESDGVKKSDCNYTVEVVLLLMDLRVWLIILEVSIAEFGLIVVEVVIYV